jgi:hypothetical protein
MSVLHGLAAHLPQKYNAQQPALLPAVRWHDQRLLVRFVEDRQAALLASVADSC